MLSRVVIRLVLVEGVVGVLWICVLSVCRCLVSSVDNWLRFLVWLVLLFIVISCWSVLR